MKYVAILALSVSLFLLSLSPIKAQGEVLGIHILHPYELEEAKALIADEQNTEQWHYVTIPVTLADLEKELEWQEFFNKARAEKIIPLVRLTTRFEDEAWTVPTRSEIVELLTFLGKLEWPTENRHIIVFNEVNHAKEWGNTINPAEYASVLHFTASWAHSEQKNFIVLPAAMDLAAPNGKQTSEAFTYWNAVHTADPDVLKVIDAWNSHSYPNPGFSSSPQLTAQNSMRGFIHELNFVKEKTGRDLPVYITETGWETNRQTTRWLESYYQYALEHIWSHPQVVAVTPFLLKGSPGPFSGFSFLDDESKPTAQYNALKKALSTVKAKEDN
ncbi:MAG: hypothetical protein M3Q81_04695 [bacterium]|nr:hypothetical protein [bacterium]